MEVLIGGSTTFGAMNPPSRLFPDHDGEGSEHRSEIGSPEDAASDSSSIGSPSDDEVENSSSNGDEADSKFRGGSLASVDSLEDSLPIKRGLSTHFTGKSKSFASLADVCTVKDIKKTENPLNKKRRIFIASKWAKKSFYIFGNPTKSMPLLALMENDEYSLGENDGAENRRDHGRRGLEKFHEKGMKSLKMRCFSLADLQEEHSELDDDDDHDHEF